MPTRALNPRVARERMARAEANPDAGAFLVTWQGTELPLFPDERSATDAAEYRRQTGLSLAGMIQALGDETQMDTDVVAAVVWLALRHNGDNRVTVRDVSDQITDGTLDDVVDVDLIGDTDDPDTAARLEAAVEERSEDPKASGGNSATSSPS